MLGICCILQTAEEPVFISVGSSEALNEDDEITDVSRRLDLRARYKDLFCQGDYNSRVFIFYFSPISDKDGSVEPVPFKQEPVPDEKADTIVAAVDSIIKLGESFLKLVAAACCATFKSFTY